MRIKPLIPREQANRDVEEIVAYCLSEIAETARFGFLDARGQAYAHISLHPAPGSPRYAHDLNLPDLCVWPLARHPRLMLHVDQADHVDVWRVLHSRRGIPAWMQESETG